MNLNPKVWGPHGWFFIESIVLSLPNKLNYEQKNIYKNFFTSLQDILPCEGCREHYNQNLIKYPLTDTVLSKKENMIRWILNVHNNVRRNNKNMPISINHFFEYYNKQYDDNYNKNKISKDCNFKYYISIIIILILIIFIFIFYKSPRV
jgi:hypothetical protein